VGSSYEPGGITGVSHVLEHMMFKGTENLKPGEFSEIIAANGGDENAFTGRDYTPTSRPWPPTGWRSPSSWRPSACAAWRCRRTSS
jgi:hypothetical protein